MGIVYFGAVEGNPLMAQLTSSSLFAYSIIKLFTTVILGFIFYKAKKILYAVEDKNGRTFKISHIGFRVTYVFATIVLLIAVINNIFVVTQII